jgi:site-specific DNA recombinase
MTEKSRKQMFCAVYTRKSVEDGLEQEFNSLDAQREAAENYIASQRDNGWTLLPKRYDDGGYSGGNTNRPALKELLADCASGLVDVVVVYKIDRLSRSIRDFAELSMKFDKWNVSFCSVTQDINTATSAGRMVLNILVTFAQYEREIIGERIRDKMRAMRRRGLWCGGNIPFGYRVEDHHLIPCPTEIPIVERIFNEFAAARRKLWQVVGDLNADGIKTRRGVRWTKRTLLTILSNCAYIGKVGCKGEMFAGNHAPMISQEIWEAAQTLLPTEVKVRKPQERMPPPLDGLVICGHCGTPMHEYSIHKNGLNYYYYRCIGDNVENCPIREIPAKKLEKLIWTFLGAGLHEANVSVTYEAITGQKIDEFIKWFDTISISALSRNKRGQLFHELIDNVRISPNQIEIEIKADCFAACPPIARETH